MLDIVQIPINPSQEQEARQMRWFNSKNRMEYICFTNKIPRHILILLQQATKELKEKLFQFLYCKINGSYLYDYGTYFNENEDDIIQTLSSIIQIGALQFRGQRYQNSTSSIQILLKLNHISNISFKNLKILNFQECFLNNIQALAWLDIKTVNELHLGWNKLISVKPLSKSSFRELKQFNISSNNDLSYHYFNSIQRCRCPKLENLYMYKPSSVKQIQNLQDYRCFVKMQIDPKRLNKQQFLMINCDQSKDGLLKEGSIKSQWKRTVNQHSLFRIEQYIQN